MSSISKEQAKLVQKALRETVNVSIAVDGVLGKGSLADLKTFARMHDLPEPEGFEGTAFELLLRYVNQRFVGDEAFASAASALGCEEAAVRAVAEVETLQDGFLKDGRLTILFERHWFYKKLREALQYPINQDHVSQVLGYNVPETAADKGTLLLSTVRDVAPDICNPVAGGYIGKEAEWFRLSKATGYNVEAAYQSASYGRFQIMGFNHTACGYASAVEMVQSFAQSETKQFEGFTSFIKADANLLSALKAKNWTRFASGYNGPNYTVNAYHTKMANAYEKWKKVLS